MDELTAALAEFLALTELNLKGRHPVEAGIRARALQELSALSTEHLAALAAMAQKPGWIATLAVPDPDPLYRLKG